MPCTVSSHIIHHIGRLASAWSRTDNFYLPATLLCELFKFVDNLLKDNEATAFVTKNGLIGDFLILLVSLSTTSLFYPNKISNEHQIVYETLQDEASKFLFTIVSEVG